MKYLIALVVVLSFAACQGQGNNAAVDPVGKRCADLMMQTVEASAPVAGSYDCLNADEQTALLMFGASQDDAGLYDAINTQHP